MRSQLPLSRPLSRLAGRRTKRKKEKVKFNDDKTKDAAGNSAIPHQSHATAGKEEEGAEEATEECPHCNGAHTLPGLGGWVLTV